MCYWRWTAAGPASYRITVSIDHRYTYVGHFVERNSDVHLGNSKCEVWSAPFWNALRYVVSVSNNRIVCFQRRIDDCGGKRYHQDIAFCKRKSIGRGATLIKIAQIARYNHLFSRTSICHRRVTSTLTVADIICNK